MFTLASVVLQVGGNIVAVIWSPDKWEVTGTRPQDYLHENLSLHQPLVIVSHWSLSRSGFISKWRRRKVDIA